MTTEQTYAGYSAGELRRMIQRGIPPTDVPMTGEMWQDYIAMYDAATAILALLDRIAALEAEAAPLRALWAAVEGLEQAIKPKGVLTVQYAWHQDEQPAHFVTHLRDTTDPYHRGYLFGRPTLAAALVDIALAAQVGEAPDA